MVPTRTWIIAMDLTERSHGAILFGSWLRERSTMMERLRGIHVTSATDFQHEHPGAGMPMERARQSCLATLEALHAASAFESVEVNSGDSVEGELARLAQLDDADGLIVGRAAPVEGWSLISLGTVARRLLRSVPSPLVVVPPDLVVTSLGGGPIVVAVDPTEHSVAPARLGVALSRQLRLPLLFLHVQAVPMVMPLASSDPGIGAVAVMAQAKRIEEGGRLAIHDWVEEHGLEDVPLQVVSGHPGPRILDVAEAENASMIVCGTRRLSLGERIFSSSTSSELAAKARCPVMVVPT